MSQDVCLVPAGSQESIAKAFPSLPHVVVCGYGRALGNEVATGLSVHPFEVSLVPDLEGAKCEDLRRQVDLLVLVEPKDPADEVYLSRENFPHIPVLLITPSGHEMPAAQDVHFGRLDELKSSTALREICWWVANELSTVTEPYRTPAGQVRPILMSLNEKSELLSDEHLLNLWVFPSPRPQKGESFLPWIMPEDRETFMREMNAAKQDQNLRVFLVRIRKGDEPAAVVEAGLRRGERGEFFLVIQPVANEVKNSWRHLATHDPLTQLLNRWEMARIMAEPVERRKGAHLPVLVYLDLDHFKTINDLLGHAAADQILIQVADKLREFFPAPAILSRFMGDEFLLLTRGLQIHEAEEHLLKLQTSLQSMKIPGLPQDFQLNFSAGLTHLLPGEGNAALQKAEAAMHEAKLSGRARVLIHKPGHPGQSLAQVMLEALNEGRFVPWFQTVVDAKTSQPVFYEALARLRTGTDRFELPAYFLYMRDTQGLISRMDRAIFIQVLNVLFEHPEVKVSVNLSPQTFALAPFPNCFLRLVRDGAVETERILVEISEECMKMPKPLVAERIAKMREVGMQVLLDDFGSGTSPLAYLTDFPFSMVKLDANVTQRIEKDKVQLDFLHAILDLTRARGIKTVAEFVDHEEQRELLVKSGVDYLQGYLFSPPIPKEKCFPRRIPAKAAG
jgi:diguanylate cyclase (GGDEF)-like protein